MSERLTEEEFSKILQCAHPEDKAILEKIMSGTPIKDVLGKMPIMELQRKVQMCAIRAGIRKIVTVQEIVALAKKRKVK
jgi:hypothetical protein